jgi:hypothetical protein
VCSLSYPACKVHATYHIFICGLSGSGVFFHIVINGTIFGKNITDHKMCVLIFSTTLCEIFLILGRIKRDIVPNVSRYSCEVAVILVRFSRNLNFLNILPKNTQISNFMKIRPVRAELFRADG